MKVTRQEIITVLEALAIKPNNFVSLSTKKFIERIQQHGIAVEYTSMTDGELLDVQKYHKLGSHEERRAIEQAVLSRVGTAVEYVPMTDDEMTETIACWFDDKATPLTVSRYIERAVLARLGVPLSLSTAMLRQQIEWLGAALDHIAIGNHTAKEASEFAMETLSKVAAMDPPIVITALEQATQICNQAGFAVVRVETLQHWRELVDINPKDLAPRIDAALDAALDAAQGLKP